MLYNYLLFFLGFYSWNFKATNFYERILQKKTINLKLEGSIKNNKKLVNFDYTNSDSPNLNFYNTVINLNGLSNLMKIKIYIYNLYSLFIFIFLCIQPTYLFYKLCENNENLEEYLITFMININTPINYIWAKYYFNTNHYDSFNNSCNYNCWSYIVLIIIITIISIVINLFNIDTFYNEYYYINHLNKSLGITLVVIEWIYARLMLTFSSCIFTIVFCKHIKDIKKFINNIGKNEYDLEDSYCLSSLISNIGILRHSIEISITFYNNLLSIITITGGISLAIFIKHFYFKYQETSIVKFQPQHYFIIQFYVLYILCQGIFFFNIFYYSIQRNRLIKLVQSSFFINKFLTRWSSSKIEKKCKDSCEIKKLNKMIICLEQENASSIDWIILDKLTECKWLDFSILGISTQDGSLIKKVIAFSSIIYFVLSYL
jgi:hypothetical protein